MSLRRALGVKESTAAALLIESKNGTANSNSHPRAHQKWILATFLCLLTAAVYTSSAPLTTSNGKDTVRKTPSLRASSHTLAKFEPIHPKCTVWMAASSVKGLQGYGVFTTRDLAPEEEILGVPDGISIPIIGYHQRRGSAAAAKDAWINVWDNYWWGSGVADHVSYEAGPDVVDFQIAFGALPNHHCLLSKLDYLYPEYDDSMADRFLDPGAGAFTYSHGRQFTVRKAVQAASEIFLNYGYCTHNDEDAPEWVENAFVTSDFSKASSLIWQTLEAPTHKEAPLLFENDTGSLIPPKDAEPLVLKLLPDNREELQEIGASVRSKTELSYYLAEHKGLDPHSTEWIEKNGMCLENILPSRSTLPHAGQGAFAQYAIRKGEIVMPAPLLQIMDRRALELYDERSGKRVNDQLLLNYCFSHPESTLLLCPDTQAVLINHCSERTKECGQKGPNASVRWSRGWDPTSDAWRKMSWAELSSQKGRGLAFEVYALRDIQPGEEIFYDYGIEFEKSWQDHVREWKPQPRPKDWITAAQANENTESILPQFIAGDLRNTVDHPYLFTACQYHKSKADNSAAYSEPNKDWPSLKNEEILDRYAESAASYGYPRHDMGYKKHSDTSHWPCSVLLEDEETGTYTVRLHQNPWEDVMPWQKNNVPRLLTGYRRENIHYLVRPYKSDQQMPGAFRHPIGFPENISFPEQWKNLK